MKSYPKRIACFFLALLVLFTNTGFGLVEHSCLMQGKKTAIAYHIVGKEKSKSCCKNPSTATKCDSSKTTLSKQPCCSEKENYQNISYPSSISEYLAQFVQSVIACIVSGFVFLAQLLFEALLSALSFFLHLSPPSPSGRSLLALIQTFLI